tara:strand:+ start:394 stop:678 length:285 start_codon:yes stop_codon:yes gene_type:complete
MDKMTKYFVKENGKIDKKKTKKLEEMNKVFEKTLQDENVNMKTGYFSGPARQVMNDFVRQFVDEDTARAMRHARKAGRIMRSRKMPTDSFGRFK